MITPEQQEQIARYVTSVLGEAFDSFVVIGKPAGHDRDPRCIVTIHSSGPQSSKDMLAAVKEFSRVCQPREV